MRPSELHSVLLRESKSTVFKKLLQNATLLVGIPGILSRFEVF